MKRAWLLILGLLLLAGCNILAYPAYLLFGQPSRTIKAEYAHLADRTVALVLAGPPAIDFEYPYARNDLGLAVRGALGQHVKNIRLVPQEKVDDLQRSDPAWLSLGLGEIAAKLGAQRVLYLELVQFTMREPESINLFRGHIWAEVSVYEADASQPHRPSYQTQVQVVHPEQAPLPAGPSAQIAVWRQSLSLFAQELTGKFYDHKATQ